jgi:hypothetical protein
VSSDAFDTARERYRAAYAWYRARSKIVMQKLESGAFPSTEEIEAEAQATERLVAARRALMQTIRELGPPPHR